MIRTVPKIQYTCPKCKKVCHGDSGSQVWLRYSMHLEKCSVNAKEKEEMLKKYQIALGISDEELKSIKTPRKQTIRCPKCDHEWKGKNPFHRKSPYIKCPRCKRPIPTLEAQKELTSRAERVGNNQF